MVQVIEQGDIFGRIGKGLGEGLSDQLPKAMERKQLSSALAGIKGLPPEIAKLAGAPGGADYIQTVLPYVQSQRQKEAVGQKHSGISREGVPSTEIENGLPPKFDQGAANYLVPSTAEAIDGRAVELSDRAGIPFEQAQQIEQRKEDKRIQGEMAFEERQNLTRSELERSLTQELQKAGLDKFKDISGDLQEIFNVKALNAVSNGMSPKQAAAKYAKEALEFAKSRQNLKGLGGVIARAFKRPEDVRKSVETIRDSYKKLGQEEYFANDLITYQGLSTPYANYLASPVKNNKEINNLISELPQSGTVGAGIIKESGAPVFGQKKTKNESAIVEDIAKHIKSSDSLTSIALSLQGRGYDPNKFLDAVMSNKNIPLTDRQRHELEDRTRMRPNLNDIFLFSSSGLDKILEQK